MKTHGETGKETEGNRFFNRVGPVCFKEKIKAGHKDEQEENFLSCKVGGINKLDIQTE